jgi:hypothetical protein
MFEKPGIPERERARREREGEGEREGERERERKRKREDPGDLKSSSWAACLAAAASGKRLRSAVARMVTACVTVAVTV